MDYIIDYLKSGQAWVLIGSGPSIEMGYPTWENLASTAAELAKAEGDATEQQDISLALKRKDFPAVFDKVAQIVGGARLRQRLQESLRPSSTVGRIYQLMARWPVPVYLTTNFDDEIHNHLVGVGEAYRTYSNSEDHLSFLTPDLNGAIFKLHGDLRSDAGLVLTAGQYKSIAHDLSWEHWRTKMTSVFQMQRIVVIGHSLADANIKHVLSAATRGARVISPICWIAPDVTPQDARKFLEDYRIRVVAYDNKDGRHRNLLRLIQSISNFIPSRTTVHIQRQIANIAKPELGEKAGATGFFVFNKLAARNDPDEKRIDILLAAILSVLPKLGTLGEFDLETSLRTAGWPENLPLSPEFSNRIAERALKHGILTPVGAKFTVGQAGETLSAENQSRFTHTRERFAQSIVLRLRRDFPTLSEVQITRISTDIESSLVGFFREGGLTLATALFSGMERGTPIPSSIIPFIKEVSSQYDTLLERQAFMTIALDIFIHAESAEREYLGRISQGYFAFHALGVFGDAAIQRLGVAKQTVWLLDSNLQISALALASPTNTVVVETLMRLKESGVRFFSTDSLFEETREHLWYANTVIRENGASSTQIALAATGQPPFRRKNEFLQGFIRWQAAGNPCDWEGYQFVIFRNRNPSPADIKLALQRLGVEVVAFRAWPGFSENDLADAEACVARVKSLQQVPFDRTIDLDRKVQPESEGWVVIKKERAGAYNILSAKGEKSQAWFVSDTSLLNLVEDGLRVTWQPEAFLRFAATLCPIADPDAVDRAFETLLWEFAQSGVDLLTEKEAIDVFGGVIDQANITIQQELSEYENALARLYGESADSVLKRIPPLDRPLAAIQIAREAAQLHAQRAEVAEMEKATALRHASAAQKKLTEVQSELGKVEKFRRKMSIRGWELAGRKKKQQRKGRARKK